MANPGTLYDPSDWTFDLIKTAEAAKILNQQPETLRAWRSSNDGPPYVRMAERAIRYHRLTLQKWATENQAEKSDV